MSGPHSLYLPGAVGVALSRACDGRATNVRMARRTRAMRVFMNAILRQRLAEVGDEHAAEELLRRGGASLCLKAEHAAEAVEELAGAGVLRMGLQARIVDARDGRMAPQKTRQRERVRVLLADAQRERLEPAMEKDARVR